MPDDADDATRYRLWDMLGTAYGSSGRLDDAIVAYQRRSTQGTKRVGRAVAHHGIGEAYHGKGAFDKALRHLDIALKEVGYQRPTSLAGSISASGRMPFSSTVYRDASLNTTRAPTASAGWISHSRPPMSAFKSLRSAACLPTFTTHISLGRSQRGAEGPNMWPSRTRNSRMNCGGFGLHRLARVYIRAALNEVASRPHDVTWARVLAQVGAALYFAGRLDEGEALSRQSMEILDKVSDYYTNWTHHWLRHSHAVRGDIGKELIEAEAEILLGTTRGDDETLGWGLYGKADALARSGRTDEALVLVSRALELQRNSRISDRHRRRPGGRVCSIAGV